MSFPQYHIYCRRRNGAPGPASANRGDRAVGGNIFAPLKPLEAVPIENAAALIETTKYQGV